MDNLKYSKPNLVPAEIFRAYDVRGIVDEQLDEDLLYHLGLAIGSKIRRLDNNTVAVGADGRLSSPRLSQALIEGLAATGCEVYDVGAVPTPLLYFAVKTLPTHSGVMLTGSHNPSNYNGAKIVIGGQTLAAEEITALYDLIEQQDFVLGEGQVEQHNVLANYLQIITNDVVISQPLKVILDAGNGIAGAVAPQLFRELGCDVIELYCEVDGNFPNHHPDPGKPANLVDLKAAMVEHQADIGLAFDGDGDRVGIITPNQAMIYPDKLLMLFAEDVLSRNPGAEIIYDVKCTRLMKSFIAQKGGKPTMWKTGHSLIKRKMIATGSLLAGEMSGHVFFKERWFGFDDGIYSAARLCEILANRGIDADALFAKYPEDVSTPEINITVEPSQKFALVEALQAWPYDEGEVSLMDGLRVDFADGWGLVRASNTTPVLVLRFEGEDMDALIRIRQRFQQHLLNVHSDLIIPEN